MNSVTMHKSPPLEKGDPAPEQSALEPLDALYYHCDHDATANSAHSNRPQILRRVSANQYVTYTIVSTLVAIAYTVRQHDPAHLPGPAHGILFITATSTLLISHPKHDLLNALLALTFTVLAYILGYVVPAIQTWATLATASDTSDTQSPSKWSWSKYQQCGIHFSLAWTLISELEYIRALFFSYDTRVVYPDVFGLASEQAAKWLDRIAPNVAERSLIIRIAVDICRDHGFRWSFILPFILVRVYFNTENQFWRAPLGIDSFFVSDTWRRLVLNLLMG
ncbi:hypothetical protein BKA63DRAFT_514284 [Paraphoma chrysanthemicola]|nr:hypothetical protein BKA63DRAFT_514284 [Paraphoma chrysanthemicola]